MSTHVLDKQIDKMLGDEGFPDGMANFLGNRGSVAGWCSRFSFCHLLLSLVYLRA